MESSIIKSISRSDLSALAPLPNASVKELRHLASYNWIEAKAPTIIVPGLPPLWRGDNSPRQLKKDSGLVYIAQNAARHPESPLEPLFRALYIEDPLFDISSVDIISDRNNIRKLLSFVDPSSDSHGIKDFTMRMESVNSTAILHREEAKTQEFIGPDEFRGFGHEFEKAYTTNQIPSSTGHHRIVLYRLGSLRLIVRHETDAYVDTETPSHGSGQGAGGDDLSDLLESMSISRPAPTEDVSSTFSKLIVRRGGRSVALESTVEIKTRVQHKPFALAEAAPQLWLSQTPRLVRAYHDKGRFRVPVVEDIRSGLQRWEEANQKNLGKLVALLVSIITEGKPHGHVSIRYDAAKDKLFVEQCAAKTMFPADIYERWQGSVSQKSDKDGKRDDMQSSSMQTDLNTKAGASSLETSVLAPNADRDNRPTVATTPEPAQRKPCLNPELPCFVCKRMRDGNPRRHGSLKSTGEIRSCLLCSRNFCEAHVSEDKAICEIKHNTYYQGHRHLSGVYPSLAAKNAALGKQSVGADEELD